MADLVTRIIAEDKQFNDKIERSKKQTKQFGETGKLAQGALLKMAGAMGVATSAGAVFKKIIDSSQTSADGFQVIIGGAKTTVDQFFKSISTGDFTNFINGLDDVYRRAKNAEKALDQLWNTQLSFSVLSSDTLYDVSQARADATDLELPPEKRREALKSWESAIEELRGYADTFRQDNETAVKKVIQTYSTLGDSDFNIEDIRDVFSLDLINPETRGDVKDAIFEQYKEYTDAVEQAEKDATRRFTKYTKLGNGKSAKDTYKAVDQKVFQPALQELNKEYKDVILTQSLLEAAADDQLEKIGGYVTTYSNLGKQISDLEMQINRSKPRIEKQINEAEEGAGSGGNIVKKLAQGSIAQLEQQISEAQKVFMNATTDEARRSADELIKSLESRKAIIEIGFKYPGGVGDVTGPLSELRIGGEGGWKKIAIARETLKKTPKKTPKETPKVDMSGVVQPLDYKPVSTYSDYVYEAARRNEDLTSSLYSMGDAMSSISNIVGEGAGAWLQYGASVLQAVGQGLPAILAMTAAKKAEATANAASAATGAASSVAGIPIVGPILAISAVASIVAALANLPKFATGGIVGGSSFSGDNVLARVNSGELILNAAQQKNLAGALTGGNVRFEIEGKTLVGVLNNEGARRSRR